MGLGGGGVVLADGCGGRLRFRRFGNLASYSLFLLYRMMTNLIYVHDTTLELDSVK